MFAANLLAKKRDGLSLNDDEIRFLIDGFCQGTVADYQMSALAMAICLQGMTPEETASLTRAMRDSGDEFDRQVSAQTPRVDKHSTGGLGDKVSLILAPLLAACGAHVPMISGRGLGLTGGTLDKLESINGFRTDLAAPQSDKVLRDAGAFIVGANERIAPADRRLYALRDVTATVESVALITASILSKKLAASLDALVMDVKVGSAAFMKTPEQARELATSLQRVGAAAGLPTSVLLSDMDQPLGQAVGNAIEVNEAVAILECRSDLSPATMRVRELTLALGASLLTTVKLAADADDATRQLTTALDSGAAHERWMAMVDAQGGRWNGDLPLAPQRVIHADRDGYVSALDCHQIGSTIVLLGGGRQRVGDSIDPEIGIAALVQIGDAVQRGQPLLRLHCHRPDQNDYVKRLQHAVVLAESPVQPRPLLL
ncbi:thymidine phosphorylase [Stieleria sp. TO1_6]|uniref:thymidine phosphorylase n=1 Tax=Stieleria tagensis TaxID=2956795 RepID=UPI00209B43CC|nr:thymidine phosphorylase [Stieleria tagensis]MCO8124071.1 thymidine phosphorylase [Stieleria tagensis]